MARHPEIPIILSLTMILAACAPANASRTSPDLRPVITTVPTALPFSPTAEPSPTYIPYLTPTEYEKSLSFGTGKFQVDATHTVVIDMMGEPHLFNQNVDMSQDLANRFPIRTADINTGVTTRSIELQTINGAVLPFQLYEIGAQEPNLDQNIQIGLNSTINFYRQLFIYMADNFSPDGKSQEVIDAHARLVEIGPDAYLQEVFASFSNVNTMTVWNDVGIEGYEGKPYTFVIPPTNPTLCIPPPSADQVADIVHYKTGFSTFMNPAQMIVDLTQPVKASELKPEFIMSQTAAAQTFYDDSSRQLGITINPTNAHIISPDIDSLQTEDAVIQSASANEFANVINEGMSPPMQDLFIFTLDQLYPLDFQRLDPGLLNQMDENGKRKAKLEYASTLAMFDMEMQLMGVPNFTQVPISP